jgi:hypothetical protein
MNLTLSVLVQFQHDGQLKQKAWPSPPFFYHICSLQARDLKAESERLR